MKSKKYLFMFLTAIAVVACQKNDDSRITYPSVYRKSGLKPAGELRLFSSNGEIRVPALLSRFNFLDSANFTNYSNYARDNQETMNRIQFQDIHYAIITDRYLENNCRVTRESSRMILSGIDTIVGYSQSDEFTRSPSYYISTVKPDVYAEYLVSSTGGFYQFGYTGRGKYILDRYRGQLVAPFIIFTQHRQQEQYTLYINNILEEDFYKDILPGDTIALKEYLLLYDK
jgi:hypothetical protein